MKFGQMKYGVLAAAGFLVGLAGCVVNRGDDYDPAVELAFRPQLYVQVRSDIPAPDATETVTAPETVTDALAATASAATAAAATTSATAGSNPDALAATPTGTAPAPGNTAPETGTPGTPGTPASEAIYPEALPFGVSAWLLPEGQSFADHAAEASEFLTRCEVAYDGAEWSCVPTKEWSPKTTRLSFIGYAPYDAAAGCDAVRGVVFDNVDTSLEQTDLLYTDVVADRSKTESGGEVALPFRHALCRVDFRVKNLVADDEKVVVRSITLDAAAQCGSFHSLPEPAWQLDASRAPITFFEGEAPTDHTPREAGRSVLMLPQELDAPVTVEYDYTASHGVVLHQRLSTKTVTTRLEAGRHYVYTLSVGIDEVKFLLEVIENHFD